MSEQPVFDAWGNEIGKFVPTGGGEGCFILLALLLAIPLAVALIGMMAIPIVVPFLMVVCVVEGFRQARKGSWKNALVAWGIPAVIVLTLSCVATLLVGGMYVQEQQRQAAEQQTLNEIRELEANPPIVFKVWKGKCTSPRYNDCPWGNQINYLFIEVTNQWKGRIATQGSETKGGSRIMCNNDLVWHYISSGETHKFACVLQWGGPKVESVDSIERVCVGFVFEVSSYDPMFQREPKPTICRDVR